MWVVNPTTLEVIREIPVADVRAVAAGAGSSIACTLAGPSTLSVIDLKQGMIVNSLEMNQPRVGSVFSGYCRSLRMTPDGKTLFVGTTCIVRIAVEGSELRFLEKSEELNSAGASLVLISPDGHFVATRNGGPFAVYDAANLKEKILLLPTTGSSVTLDLDSVMQRAIVGSDGQLNSFRFGAASKRNSDSLGKG